MQGYESLVELAQAPDADLLLKHDAFSELVTRFQDMAYGFAYATLGDKQLAQGAAQEAFISAYQNLPQLREPRAFPAWLKRIILTQCHRLTRQRHLSTQPLEAVPELQAARADPAMIIEDQELREQVLSAIHTLPERLRVATVLYYINGYTQHEVANFLEVSEDVVKQRLLRSREQLKKRIIDMVRDDLQKQRPSNDERFLQAVQLATILEVAAADSQLATLELLLVDGMGANARGKDERTLLHWAAREGHLGAAKLLLKYGADPLAQDRFGKTPLQEAEDKGYHELAELLRQH